MWYNSDIKRLIKEEVFMGKIIVIGANHAGTAAINTILDNGSSAYAKRKFHGEMAKWSKQ